MPASNPLKWHGGKSYLADRIISYFPPHIHYVEPYFGGGAVFFKKPLRFIEGHSEVINDIYQELITFWRVLKTPGLFHEFHRRIHFIPFAKPEWECSSFQQPMDSIELAVNFFVRYRQSRQGLGKDFATLSRTRTRSGMNEQVSAWLGAIQGLPEAHQRLQRPVIFCENALKVIEREDGPETLFYCDAPYVCDTRSAKTAYDYEMTNQQHEELVAVLIKLKGKVMVSMYHHPIYDALHQKHGWQISEFELPNHASSSSSKRRMTECLWMNYSL